MSDVLIILGAVAFAFWMEFGESYEAKMARVYKRTAEDVNWNRERCPCGRR